MFTPSDNYDALLVRSSCQSQGTEACYPLVGKRRVDKQDVLGKFSFLNLLYSQSIRHGNSLRDFVCQPGKKNPWKPIIGEDASLKPIHFDLKYDLKILSTLKIPKSTLFLKLWNVKAFSIMPCLCREHEKQKGCVSSGRRIHVHSQCCSQWRLEAVTRGCWDLRRWSQGLYESHRHIDNVPLIQGRREFWLSI